MRLVSNIDAGKNTGGLGPPYFVEDRQPIMELISSPEFWTSLCNIVLVNVMLSGDNAVVIALAAHSLPAKQQKPAIVLGGLAAILMRTVLTIFALRLLALPYLKIVGGILLFGIAVKLMRHEYKTDNVSSHSSIAEAVKTILVADLVMSLDNVLGVAAAAHGNLVLLIVGLLLSVPLIIFGSTAVLKVMQKYPVVITLGAALLGYLAGEMLFSDVALATWVNTTIPHHDVAIWGDDVKLSLPGLLSAIAVIFTGSLLKKWKTRHNTPM